ncbi:mitochondrial 54S ribosomal protein bL33m [Dipodascopsis tothii]|uniref:mitochondrial 54S ribosomal protein bL33m n=1 Tax=Dipodascopsis tothii TaxID=44089 RepID=UPI0034CD2E55
MAKKAKARTVLVKLISSAMTGFIRTVHRPRTSPMITQVRYDPIVRRHVLFEESKKRPLGNQKVWGFGRRL